MLVLSPNPHHCKRHNIKLNNLIALLQTFQTPKALEQAVDPSWKQVVKLIEPPLRQPFNNHLGISKLMNR